MNKICSVEEKISYICMKEYKYLLNKRNVVGVALGYKTTNGFYTCQKCIAVFVIKKLAINELDSNQLIPKYYNGIPTDVVQCDKPKFDALTAKVRPVINGYSISNILQDDTAGTCGCLVHDKYLYILSNNHVFASNNRAEIQTSIIQPSIYDGGKNPKDVIAHLYRFIPIKFIEGDKKPENQVDCAIAKVISRSFVSSAIAFIGVPKGISKAILLQKVRKVGRTTEETYGKVTYTNGTIIVQTEVKGKEALFTNQIITSKMTTGGDSGSLLVDEDLNAVGLCMSSTNQNTIVNPIESVLNSLKVKLVTG
ncbi:trypsin-like serine protease [Clostridium botulinum]|uniref:Nal1 N-terminal domain-containing protein n=1 Tax=Clostridium botulinum C/D str. DC5 TaxID=1443128 RepID=A0A0A0IH22_CLOBO|nr:trypsin-like peptidase domain-containing protein [Clostridium botulinum]KEI00193.1 hypothetical protein Z952_01920 [Clostridium botulinum C/D str. BKT75002]KEI09351.1 hypothetical protein Z954_13110 [Clostridium botulinum C/D str. BKT2873]KGM94664.1 hypothetical protein Z956_06800 [Clostridium botulinum D str. CCUG 7971]KGM99893.1 hypothetical protein Z955_05445 [Clostridium botulinum C/D str. DC5]KOC49402.1 hypothetical protein ADU88_06270 [Clostridium botulinum]